MKKLIKIQILIFLLVSSSFAKNKFLELSTGLGYTPYSKKDLVGSIETKSLDKSTYLYHIAMGTKIKENIFSSINYQRSNLTGIYIDDFYVSLDYKLDNKVNPYLGLILGKSYLNWKIDPINDSKNKDYTSQSFLYGIQTGFDYPVSKSISFSPKITYLITKHKTNLRSLPAISYIRHNERFNLYLGFRIAF